MNEIANQEIERETLAILNQLGQHADLYILAAAARSRTFWKSWSDIICVEPTKPGAREDKRVHCDDFQLPIDNAVYMAIHQSHIAATLDPVETVSPTLVMTSLQAMIRRGVMLSELELPMALQRVTIICGPTVPPDCVQVASRLVKAWVMQRRQMRIASRMSSSRLGLDRIRDELNQVVQHIESGEVKDSAVLMGISLEGKVQEILPAYDAVSPALCKLMGGGYRKKEGTLKIAANGVGKTVDFAQCGFDLFDKHHLKILQISTEQEPEEVELRNISREGNIPFHKLADGFDVTRLNPDELNSYRAYVARVAQRRAAGGDLRMLKWKKGDKGLHTKLNDLILFYRDQMGGLDGIMLDWLGGGVELTTAAATNFRLYMQMLADAFAESVRTHTLIGIAYAQARNVKGEGYDNWKVRPENMQENKSLGNNFTNIIGMSGMRENDGGSDQPGAQVAFKALQNNHVSKARKGSGGDARFSRAKFSYQRLIDA